jgi:glycosyltransferase involved in cell wall biosynthesis
LIPLKQFGAVIDAMPAVIAKVPEARLVIAGDGPMRKELEDKIVELNLLEHVILAGRLDREVFLRYLRAADVFVQNSVHETFSHELVEALSLGTPVIATRVGGTPEIIKHNKNGVLISPNKSDELEKTLIKLLTDKKYGASLAQSGKESVRELTTSKCINKTIEVLTKVCNQNAHT